MELIIIILIYFAPTIIAGIKSNNDTSAIFMCNLLFGWTLIFWIILLFLAISE